MKSAVRWLIAADPTVLHVKGTTEIFTGYRERDVSVLVAGQ